MTRIRAHLVREDSLYKLALGNSACREVLRHVRR